MKNNWHAHLFPLSTPVESTNPFSVSCIWWFRCNEAKYPRVSKDLCYLRITQLMWVWNRVASQLKWVTQYWFRKTKIIISTLEVAFLENVSSFHREGGSISDKDIGPLLVDLTQLLIILPLSYYQMTVFFVVKKWVKELAWSVVSCSTWEKKGFCEESNRLFCTIFPLKNQEELLVLPRF